MSIHTQIPATATALPPHIVGGIPSSNVDWDNIASPTKSTPVGPVARDYSPSAIIAREPLAKALSVAKLAVDRRNNTPILQNALLRESKGEL